MEFWFSFHRKHRSPLPRQTKFPRATFPFTINALLCPDVEDDERMISSTILLLAAKRPSDSRLIFDFDRILSRARHSGAIDVSLFLSLFGEVRFISGMVSQGLGITPTNVVGRPPFVVCRLVARTASPSSSTDSKKQRRRNRRGVRRFGTRANRRKFDPSLFRPSRLYETTRLISCRVCACARASRKPPPIGCVAGITLAAWQNASSYQEKSRTLPSATA